MGFFADLKTKREAKKAQRIYQLELQSGIEKTKFSLKHLKSLKVLLKEMNQMTHL